VPFCYYRHSRRTRLDGEVVVGWELMVRHGRLPQGEERSYPERGLATAVEVALCVLEAIH
jgi:hypothetical protein